MKEKDDIKRKIIIRIPPKIYTNKELNISEKLVLALDYSFSSKKGYTILSNVEIGKLLNLHQNTVGKNRKSLIEKGYLEKDSKDKRKHILITKKLDKVELPLINGKTDRRTLILPFEIYNNPNLTDGAKLFWGDVHSFRENKEGYYQQRETTALRFNVSEDSITNWTKELNRLELLEEYEIKSGYYWKQRTIRTKEINDINGLNDVSNISKEVKTNNFTERKVSKEEDIILPLGAIDVSELYNEKQNENVLFNNNDFNKNLEKKGGVKGFSQLGIKEKKYNDDDDFENYEEDEDEDY